MPGYRYRGHHKGPDLFDATDPCRPRVPQEPKGPPPLRPCGTYAAYKRHLANDEETDQACEDAYTVYQAEAYARRKARRRAQQTNGKKDEAA